MLLFHLSFGQENNHSWVKIKEIKLTNAVNIAGFFNSDSGAAACRDLIISYHSGKTMVWKFKNNSDRYFCGFDFIGNDTVILSGAYGIIFITKNGGFSWKEIAYAQNAVWDIQFKSLSFISSGEGWLANSSSVFKISDKGKKWEELKLPPDSGFIAAVFLRNKEEGYILNNKGVLYRTADAGKNWDYSLLNFGGGTPMLTLSSMQNPPLAAIQFSDMKKGSVVIYFIKPERQWAEFHTSDGGKTWKGIIIPHKDLGSVYLSRNGKFLTITDTIDRKIFLFKKK